MISKEKLTILVISICMGVLGYIIEYFLGQQEVLFIAAIAIEVIFGVTIFMTLVDFYSTFKKMSTKILFSSIQTLLAVGAYILSLYCIQLALFCMMSYIFAGASAIWTTFYVCKYISSTVGKK